MDWIRGEIGPQVRIFENMWILCNNLVTTIIAMFIHMLPIAEVFSDDFLLVMK